MRFPDFADILTRAIETQGSPSAIDARLPDPKQHAKATNALSAIPDDRWLAGMAKAIFSSGFVWSVVERKWPDIEQVFDQFDVPKVAFYSPDALDRIASDARGIRHATKIAAIVHNAQWLAGMDGSAGRFFAEWPDDDTIGLWSAMKTQGKRLGGNTGPFFLRRMGRDTFILTDDVIKALVRLGAVDKAPTSKSALAQVNTAFNHWRDQSGEPLSRISRLLALTIG